MPTYVLWKHVTRQKVKSEVQATGGCHQFKWDQNVIRDSEFLFFFSVILDVCLAAFSK